MTIYLVALCFGLDFLSDWIVTNLSEISTAIQKQGLDITRHKAAKQYYYQPYQHPLTDKKMQPGQDEHHALSVFQKRLPQYVGLHLSKGIRRLKNIDMVRDKSPMCIVIKHMNTNND